MLAQNEVLMSPLERISHSFNQGSTIPIYIENCPSDEKIKALIIKANLYSNNFKSWFWATRKLSEFVDLKQPNIRNMRLYQSQEINYQIGLKIFFEKLFLEIASNHMLVSKCHKGLTP